MGMLGARTFRAVRSPLRRLPFGPEIVARVAHGHEQAFLCPGGEGHAAPGRVVEESRTIALMSTCMRSCRRGAAFAKPVLNRVQAMHPQHAQQLSL